MNRYYYTGYEVDDEPSDDDENLSDKSSINQYFKIKKQMLSNLLF